jgi:hypothetical protein
MINWFPAGSWELSSKTDPRWNANGDADSVGGFAIPREAAEKLAALKQELGEPPTDLEWSYMKD